MHIVLLSPAWPYGARPNGIVTYVHFMVRGLEARGHRVTVMSGDMKLIHEGPRATRIPPPSRLTQRLCRLVARPLTVFDGWRGVARAINRLHATDPVDVVEMEETFGLPAEVSQRVKAAVVTKLHGPAFLHLVEEEQSTDAGQRRIDAEGRALSTLPVITAPSLWTLDQTLARYGLHPAIAKVIANPIEDLPMLPLWDPSRCDRQRVLFVGRFDKVKGADLVIEAFARLAALRPSLRLTFVGPDSGLVEPNGAKRCLVEFVDSLGDPSVADRIDVCGSLHPSAIQLLRPQAAVTVVASRQESQGYTALEAMLQACPLVCTDSSGLSELVQHEVTGLKARSEDAADIATQIDRLLSSPRLAQKLGSAARAYVLEHHSPDEVARQTLDVYEQAISLRSQSRRA